MTIKITIPNTSSDVLTFGSANTPTAAQIAGIDSGSSNGQLALYTTASGTSTERVRVDSSGNVGIGTVSPAQKLHISGTGDTRLQVESTSSGAGVIYLNGSTAGFAGYNTIQSRNSSTVQWAIGGSGDQNTLPFYTNGSERMRIDSSGNLLVGTTSTVDSAKFVVQDAEGNDFAVGRLSGGNRFVGSSSIYNKTTANAANVFVNSSATAYAIVRSTSSIKYKKDVENAVHGLAEVLQLRPVTYRGKEDGEQVFGGLIAEEVHDIGLTEFVQYDEDGSPDALAYGPLVSLAFKAIQEQQALITQLQADVAALKGASA
jgi:hypothetical protein